MPGGMTAQDRTDVLRALGDGRLAPRDLAGLRKRDIDALETLAQSSYVGGRYAAAARVYGFLALLEPDRPAHMLRQAFALAAGGDREEAVDVASRYIEFDGPLPKHDLIDAFLLRARWTEATEPDKAACDTVAAQILQDSISGQKTMRGPAE